MKQVSIRLSPADIQRLAFLISWLRERERLDVGTSTTGAVRYALRFTVDRIAKHYEKKLERPSLEALPLDNNPDIKESDDGESEGQQ